MQSNALGHPDCKPQGIPASNRIIISVSKSSKFKDPDSRLTDQYGKQPAKRNTEPTALAH